MNGIRVLLGDDHSLILDGIHNLLASAYEVVGSASDGRSLVDAALRLKPDLVVFDVNMPILNGIEAAREIARALPGTKLVCLSMHSNAVYLRKAMESGASAYVLKSGASEELRNAIETVLKGGTFVSPGFGPAVIDRVQYEPERSRASIGLTRRQRQIIQLIADGKMNKEIAEILNVSIRTVEFHRHQLMTKLGLHNVADLTRFAIQEGLTGGGA